MADARGEQTKFDDAMRALQKKGEQTALPGSFPQRLHEF